MLSKLTHTLIVVLSACSTWSQSELHVPAVYPTIQAAANDAFFGDIIVVAPGTYAGAVTSVDLAIRGDGIQPEDVTITSMITGFEDLALENLRVTGGVGFNSGLNSLSNCVVNTDGVEFNFVTSGLVEDTLFEDCLSTALILEDAGYVVRRCQFINNSTGGNGGAIRVSDSTLDIDECLFDGNHAGGSGGAIYAVSIADGLDVDDSEFVGNTAVLDAGAIAYSSTFGDECNLTNTEFRGNTSNDLAGAVRIETGINQKAPGSVAGCRFEDNTAGPGGAALWFDQDPIQPDPQVSTSSFCGNTPADIVGDYIDEGGNTFSPSCVCLADVNGDGMLSPTDFTAWIAAFNSNAPECDQNGDGSCTPTDFTAWIANFNDGC